MCKILLSLLLCTLTLGEVLASSASQSNVSPKSFKISLEKSFVEMTQKRVENFRPTESFDKEWTREGPPTWKIESIQDYWINYYDWSTIESQINSEFHHFTTTVPGSGNYTDPLDIHFIHETLANPKAIPLLLMHGWPSSSLEWSKVIKPLAESYHVVAPDLPGFGFSAAPTSPGLGPREITQALHKLMLQLGYEKYGIITTDLGWFTGMWMVADVEESIIGHWSDFFISPPTDEDRKSGKEEAYITSFDNWFTNYWTYANAHANVPLALAQAMSDSPMGLLGWYMHINYGTSDGFEFVTERLITDAMMLWIPGAYANMRAYLEFFKPYVMDFPSSKVPTGVSEWGWGHGPWKDIADFAYVPEDWIKRKANLTYFKRHDRGGHFPAVTRPAAWADDVKEFFGSHVDTRNVKDEL